jgi:WD40 repeat protein/tRNA A-37 threonylcarbamoyl transferase component Bud32
MPLLLSCPGGHQWEETDESAAREDPLSCPICGLASTVTDRASGGPAAKTDDAPTVLQWQSFAGSNAADQPPPALPDFEILEEIGRGGMGIVYRARQLADQQIVAVKVIRKDRLQHEEAVRRFRREAQAAARLSHPHIVKVFDSDRAGATHYLVMEYVNGITLERHVEQQGLLTIAQACDFIRQAALGLQHAHEQALVHRDIKPSNLMVTPAPAADDPPTAAYQVKLLDMGVARVLQLGGQSPGESLSTLTQGGSVIGTADYVAPEQLEDPHGADIRADLYSVGCTFYFLLTGQVPFPGGSLLSKLDKQRWHAPTALTHLRADIPPAVARVVEKLMAKRPADRCQTPGELAETLALLAGHNYLDPPRPHIEFKEIRRMIGHADAVGTVRFAADGRHLASGAKDGTLLYWDVVTGQIVQRFPKHPQEIRSVAFSPTTDQIASASGFTVRLYDVRGQEKKRFSGHSGSIKCLAFSPDGKRLITGSDDKTIRLWDVGTGREVQRFSRHTAAITALAFVAHTNHFASASKDQTVRLWDIRSGLEIELFDAHAGAVLDIAVSADGKRLASGHFDTILRIWDIATAREVGQCVGHKQMVSAVAFTPDGERLLSAGQDQTLRLWDLATYKDLACASCHTAGINALSVSPDGTRVVTAGADKTLVVSALPAR